MAEVAIRPLTVLDVPAALELSTAAGWNQSAEDWETILHLAPDSCLALDFDGRLAATTTLICYGARLGWIGMVLTRSDCRRRGFATLLLRRALNIADARGIVTLKLDATEMGRPLYANLGFETEQPIERWSREGNGSSNSPPREQSVLENLDLRAFGADRSGVLRALASRSSTVASPEGYVFARAGRLARYLGPCIATSQSAARPLIENVLSSESWFWDLLPEHAEAAALAQMLGFTPARRLVRMRRGKPRRGEERLVYAIAGFEFG